MGVCALVLVLLPFLLLAPLARGGLFAPFGRHVRTAPLGQSGVTGSPRTGAAAGIVSRTAHQTRQQGGGKQQGRKAVAHGGSGKGARRVRRKESASGQGRVSSRDGTGHGCGTASSVQGGGCCLGHGGGSGHERRPVMMPSTVGRQFGRTASSTMARWMACRHIIAPWIR